MSEWFKELVLKTSDAAMRRGFESHSLRQHTLEIYTQSVSHRSKYVFRLGQQFDESSSSAQFPPQKAGIEALHFDVLPLHCSLHSTDGWLIKPDRADRRSRTARRLTPSRKLCPYDYRDWYSL